MFLFKRLKIAVLKPSLLLMGLCVPAWVLAQQPNPQEQSAQSSAQDKAVKSQPVLAKESAAAEQLVAILQAYDSLAGSFTQTLSSKAGKLLQTTEGTFKIKRPGLYLWQSAEPYPQTIVGNGETIWVYDPDLEQVTITPQAQMPFNPAMLLSGGIQDLSARFSVERISKKSDGDKSTYNLVPINTANAPFAAVSLIFNKEQIAKAVLTDRLGQQTVMTFSDLKPNSVIDASPFTFVPPKGTDVLMNE